MPKGRVTPADVVRALRRADTEPPAVIEDRSPVGVGITVRIEGTFDLHTVAAVLNGDLKTKEDLS